MTTAYKLFIPQANKLTPSLNDYNRPYSSANLFGSYESLHRAATFTDANTGTTYEFKHERSGGDNYSKNMSNAWKPHSSSNYAMHSVSTHGDAYGTNHMGTINGLNSISELKARNTYKCAGAYGVTFNYNFPADDNLSHWTDSPHGISKMMFHYYNPKTEAMFSHYASVHSCSPNPNNDDRYLWISHIGRYTPRGNDNKWYRATYVIDSDQAKAQVIQNQYHMVGLSIETKYNNRGGAKHIRAWLMKNLNCVFGHRDDHLRLVMPNATKYKTDGTQKPTFTISS